MPTSRQLRRVPAVPCLIAILAVAVGQHALSAHKSPPIDAAELAKGRQSALQFRRTTQADDGSWTSSTAPGISGLVTTALLKNGVSPDDPMAKKALAHLATFVQEDGGIYYVKSDHRNYETSICLMAFQAANKDHRHDKVVASALDFLKKLQWDESEDIKPDD